VWLVDGFSLTSFGWRLGFAELQGQTSAAVINEMRDSLIDNYA
jgi:hypothetical protein